jgi:hypothetical protein
MHAHVERACGKDRTPYFGVRGLVGAHRIENDVYWHQRLGLDGESLSSFFGRDNSAALVLTALLAGAVRLLALAAVRAKRCTCSGKEIVAAALGCALLGMAALRIRHGSSSRIGSVIVRESREHEPKNFKQISKHLANQASLFG